MIMITNHPYLMERHLRLVGTNWAFQANVFAGLKIQGWSMLSWLILLIWGEVGRVPQRQNLIECMESLGHRVVDECSLLLLLTFSWCVFFNAAWSCQTANTCKNHLEILGNISTLADIVTFVCFMESGIRYLLWLALRTLGCLCRTVCPSPDALLLQRFSSWQQHHVQTVCLTHSSDEHRFKTVVLKPA